MVVHNKPPYSPEGGGVQLYDPGEMPFHCRKARMLCSENSKGSCKKAKKARKVLR